MATQTPYSTSEKRAIESGLSAAYRLVESNGRLDAKFTAAIAWERKRRPSLSAAQAGIAEAILAGIEGLYSVADLADLSDGCAFGAIVGAYIAKKKLVTEDLLHRLRTAKEAQRLHIERFMAKIRGAA